MYMYIYIYMYLMCMLIFQIKVLELENRCFREKLDSLIKRVEVLEGNKNFLEFFLELCLR